MKEKTFDHLNSSKFKNIDHDPSTDIEKKAKKLLDNIFSDPDIEIPPKYYKFLYTQNSSDAFIQPLLKDHKPEFPNCKIRPIQPINNSAIEKLDIILGNFLSQVKPYLEFRVNNSREIPNKII